MNEVKNTSKTRNWAFVVYPESAPDDWLALLADTHIPAFVSPLHNLDIDETTGELKKEHYHIVIMYDGTITQKRANEIIAPFNGTKSAEYVKSLKGYVRYLAHLDDPDKAQYDPAEIVALSGADLNDILKNASDKYKIIGDIMKYCEENSVYELSYLTKYASTEHKDDWFPVVVEKAYLFTQFLASLRHSSQRKERYGR